MTTLRNFKILVPHILFLISDLPASEVKVNFMQCNFELSYDQHIPTKERIYRLYMDWVTEGKVELGTSMPPPLAQILKDVYPEVAEAGRINNFSTLDGPGSNQFRRADQADAIQSRD